MNNLVKEDVLEKLDVIGTSMTSALVGLGETDVVYVDEHLTVHFEKHCRVREDQSVEETLNPFKVSTWCYNCGGDPDALRALNIKNILDGVRLGATKPLFVRELARGYYELWNVRSDLYGKYIIDSPALNIIRSSVEESITVFHNALLGMFSPITWEESVIVFPRLDQLVLSIGESAFQNLAQYMTTVGSLAAGGSFLVNTQLPVDVVPFLRQVPFNPIEIVFTPTEPVSNEVLETLLTFMKDGLFAKDAYTTALSLQ